MTDKITLQSVSSVDNSLINAINNNNATLVAAIDNTLSRDGTSPNQMNSTLDMNSHQIINIPFATAPTQPVALGQIANPTSLIPNLTGDVTGSFNGTTIPTTLQPLSGDVTSSGRVVTLDTVNSNVGAFGSSSQIPTVTVNAKGQVTAASQNAVSLANNSVTNTQLAQMPAHTYKGNNTAGTTNAADITNTQLTADLNQFTTSLQGVVPGSGGGTTNFLRADGTWNAPPGGGGASPFAALFTTSQTVTIPTGMTKAYVKLWGGSGGSGGHDNNVSAEVWEGGLGAYLEKFLSGLTPGNTLAFTVGAAGSAGAATPTAGGNGGTSTLASGTQTISTLTANGGNGSGASSGGVTGTMGIGGTASGGDWNAPGGPRSTAAGANFAASGASNFYSYGGEGGFGFGSAGAGGAGTAGGMIIQWYP